MTSELEMAALHWTKMKCERFIYETNIIKKIWKQKKSIYQKSEASILHKTNSSWSSKINDSNILSCTKFKPVLRYVWDVALTDYKITE